ncbi:trans-2,3-dihydro-3-hydroxyanthranilate isomerase [Allocatelliglobosispora scoriae]|uniref:Trans-2,3-dihydro-3-hydroxyanthranilate isomerase n=1 Tax=Allocatelliglobosispora scoriae TaxID=643052 RepID=A0A841BR16_9ACTN|nr:PhzF family phenazine biosynthesis protein [Allocatelliglobosispora scoriae]MBB5871497.1 trans-2,3-dihydro-3-hydroxyanthranilate isomerase [Allocatelliglobosispora scoriae]
MISLAYEIVDVFTDRPFAGNPLAVVFGADDLSGQQMLVLAKEFNLSETIFVLPSSQATYRARIFTPDRELPFAGHPSVGAAVMVTRRGLAEPGTLTQECGAGILPIAVVGGAATLTGGAATVGDPLDPAPLLEITGLTGADVVGVVRRAGCGLEFPFLPVTAEALARASVDGAAARRHGLTDVCAFAWDPDSRSAQSRVFCPGLGVPEDPATGSAALGLGVWLVTSGLLPASGTARYTVHQGTFIDRPSLLSCTVTAVDGVVTNATVSGEVVPIATGTIRVP